MNLFIVSCVMVGYWSKVLTPAKIAVGVIEPACREAATTAAAAIAAAAAVTLQ